MKKVPGLGKRTKEILIKSLGSEDEILSSIEKRDVLKLINAGLPPRRAVELIKSFEYSKLGCKDVLATKLSKEVHRKLISIVKSFCSMEETRVRIDLFFPLPRGGERICRERMSELLSYKNWVKRLMEEIGPEGIEKIRKIVSGVKRPRKSEIDMEFSRVLISRERVNTRYTEVLDPSSVIDYSSLLERYDLVLIGEDCSEIQIDGELTPIDEIEISPEVILENFLPNYEFIKACADLSEFFKEFSEMDEIKEKIDSFLRLRKEKIKELSKIEEIITEVENWMNDEFSKRVGELKISLGGDQILRALRGETIIPEELERKYNEVIEEAISLLKERTGVDERILIELIPEKLSYPIEFKNKDLVKSEIRKILATVDIQLKRELARYLKGKEKLLTDAYDEVLEIDYKLSLGLFAMEYDLKEVKISESGGSGFKNARNIFLNGKKVDPVSYEIGETPMGFPTKGERVVLLTGANSGGKSTLLETIVLLQTMVQSGIPPPVDEGYFSFFDEIYLYGKFVGSSGAGAFEKLLKEICPISLKDGKKKLVLIDEIETVTEPGAAAKVISGIIEAFLDNEGIHSVIVTHLGEEVRELLSGKGIRIDGIEARGLNENLELIVDRSPIFGKLARSTPQLVVERMYKTSKGEIKKIYERILNFFSQE